MKAVMVAKNSGPMHHRRKRSMLVGWVVIKKFEIEFGMRRFAVYLKAQGEPSGLL
jgi:hypothetical protein